MPRSIHCLFSLIPPSMSLAAVPPFNAVQQLIGTTASWLQMLQHQAGLGCTSIPQPPSSPSLNHPQCLDRPSCFTPHRAMDPAPFQQTEQLPVLDQAKPAPITRPQGCNPFANRITPLNRRSFCRQNHSKDKIANLVFHPPWSPLNSPCTHGEARKIGMRFRFQSGGR